ncbi:MAG: Crp/Fnr family transcriptional regulator [Bacteroidetes bacterium 43-93]|nr:MAG: Crp/Fnr family transcriptional regulator [Bacteroidetes bacterium 43-93]
MTDKSKSGFTANCETCTVKDKSIFCHLQMDELITIDEHKSCIPYKKGQIIFNEGNYPLGVYCINKGKVKLAHAGQDGKEQIVKLAKEGDVLGYRSMLSSERYNASAIALEDTQICFISKEVFFSLLRKNPTLSLEIIRMLALELRLTENRLTDIAQKPVRERMAEALLFLKETYGFEKDNATISVVLSREDIANLVGTATETAIRLLSEFKHDKIVVFVGKKIKILDMDKLVKTANIYN